MPSIELDLCDDLCTKDNKLDMKISPYSMLEVKLDGLYVLPKNTDNNYHDGEYFGVEIRDGVISTTSVVHQTHDYDNLGSNSKIYPGDMYRIDNHNESYTYYLITSVDNGTISDEVYLGVW